MPMNHLPGNPYRWFQSPLNSHALIDQIDKRLGLSNVGGNG